jgi:hypothetical protein
MSVVHVSSMETNRSKNLEFATNHTNLLGELCVVFFTATSNLTGFERNTVAKFLRNPLDTQSDETDENE